jgi:hypothetical protein
MGAHCEIKGDAAGSELGIEAEFICAHSGIEGNVEGCRSLSSGAAINGFKLSGCAQSSVTPAFSRSIIRMSSNS